MKTAACSSCGATIVWTRTQGGKRMPVDAEPAANGNIVLGDGDPPAAIIVPPDERERALYPLYVSHFASCKFAAQHRRKNP